MKKLLFLFGFVLAFSAAQAQADSLQQYTGKFKFPEGSRVTEITVVMENGILTANSAIGNSELKRNEGDIFSIIAFGGTATFKRNTGNKIIGVLIEVGDIVMEGTKSESLDIKSRISYNKP